MSTKNYQRPSGSPPATGSAKQTYKAHIDATHPMDDDAPLGALEADALAMELVHERHSKRDLVDLVRWLILRNPDGLLSHATLQSAADQQLDSTTRAPESKL